MNIRRQIILSAIVLSLATTANAQVDEKTITVDDNGRKEQIDLPEAMSTDLDSLMQLYNSKMYLRPDSDCNMPDINPVYDAATYKERLSKLPTIIEMPYNSIVQAFIDRYTGELRRRIAYMLGAQNFFMPTFEEALDAYNLPLELKYLPVIESALNPMARSHAGAVGLWQFMLPTAKRYGLKVNSLVDERRDLVKASYAAAHYLSDLYNIFKDWSLVIAAYNCGPDKINKAIRRTNGERDYWKIYPKLPAETRGYVPAFIAANYVMNYYCDHNICPLSTTLPVRTDTVMLSRDVHFEQVAEVLGVDIDMLRDLNPQYRRDIVNGNSELSPLRLPASLVSTFIDKEDSVYAANPKDYKPKRTEVTVGDGNDSYVVRNNKVSLVTVAGTGASADDGSDDGETVNQKTSSTRKSTGSKRSSKKSRKSKRQRSKNVTIKNGDTLSEIAERNNTTVSKLKKLNKIKGNSIRAGKKIRVK